MIISAYKIIKKTGEAPQAGVYHKKNIVLLPALKILKADGLLAYQKARDSEGSHNE